MLDRMTSSGRFAVLAAPILIGLVACAGGPSVTALPAATASAASNQVPRSLTFQLNPIEPYTASGTVVVDITAAASYTITVNVTGLTPNSVHLLNLHYGTCAKPILAADERVDLGDAQADATGTATFTTPLFARAYTVPTGGRILTVHLEGDSPSHIACADLTD